jgi:hypothetical protein|tara:strand:+ start:113 stop:244 length:132 start_codon:yes stop_codon:yes gene_type:complete
MKKESKNEWLEEGVNFITGYKMKTDKDVMLIGKHNKTYQNIYK